MNYLNIGLDSPVSVFAIAQAHLQLESDYNRDGIVIERPSNARRKESTGCQLARLQYWPRGYWVEICSTEETGELDDEDVRDIYLQNVLKWGLPIDAEMMSFIKSRYVPEFVARYPQCAGVDYLQDKEVAA